MVMSPADVKRLQAFAAEVAVAEKNLREYVRGQRRQGVTWTSVGAALGVSRQAASKRFGHDRAGSAGALGTPA